MLPEQDEKPGARALRYILTLVAWHSAARAIIKLSRKVGRIARMPEVSLVQLADHSRDAVEDVTTNDRAILESLKAQIEYECANHPEDGTRMAQWIEDNCKIPKIIRPFRVHAEAGLMALLKMAEVHPEELRRDTTCQSAVCS